MELDKEQFDYFVKGFLMAALFATNDENDDPFDLNYCIKDFSEPAIGRIRKDCESFINMAKEFLDSGDLQQHGMDFFYVRNGHGVEFLDRDIDKEDAQKLTEIAKTFPEITLYEVPTYFINID